MKKFLKFTLVAIVLFLAVGTVEFFLLRDQKKEKIEEIEEYEEETKDFAAEKLEEIKSKEIEESDKNYNLKIRYPRTGEEEIDRAIEEFVQSNADEFKTKVNEFFEGPEPPGGFPEWQYELGMDYNVFSPSKDLVSFKFNGYMYTGGAHGIEILHTKTFSFDSGREYQLEDIFQEESDYLQKLSASSREKLKSNEKLGEFYDEQMVNPGTTPEKDNFRNFVLAKEGIIFFFGEYQVAPYSAGEQNVKFSYEELEELLKPSFLEF